MNYRLSYKTLSNVPKTVQIPRYRPEQLSAGILHIGVGNFHRAHQAYYLDKLFNAGKSHDWAIIGSGIMYSDARRREELMPQDWLTTCVEIGADTPKPRILGSMIDFCPTQPSALRDRLLNPDIRIVSLTVTEGGYFIDPDTGEFDYRHVGILHDIKHFNAPMTVFGILLSALHLRRKAGVPPFTVLSCDNLLGNGEAAHAALFGLAEQIPAMDMAWVKDEVFCPNSMVDCITPATTDKELDFIREHYGYEDAAPVFCEPFHQWVIEDRFSSGRPDLEAVGVEFTDDVTRHEHLKLNILNAGHAAIAYVGTLLGYTYAHETIRDQHVLAWLEGVMNREVLPTLSPVHTVTPQAYLKTVVERFKNPAIKDTLSRLCEDGENRQPKFVFPSIYRALKAGLPVDGLALEVGFWCQYLTESPISTSAVNNAAIASRDTPIAFIEDSGIFGDLRQCEPFVQAFTYQLSMLWQHGPRETINQYLMASHRASA